MSQGYYLEAVRDLIRSTYGFGRDKCDVTPGGRPTPKAGKLFVGITPSNWSNIAPPSDVHWGEASGFDVVVSVQCGHVAFDRLGEVVVLGQMSDQYPERGLLDRCDRLAKLLHMSYPLMNAANELIAATDPSRDGFVKPARWRNSSWMGEQSWDWFHAVQPPKVSTNAVAGVAVRVSFDSAELYDSLDDTEAYALP